MNARLNPEAKKPPNGPIIELNRLKEIECKTNGYRFMVLLIANYKWIKHIAIVNNVIRIS